MMTYSPHDDASPVYTGDAIARFTGLTLDPSPSPQSAPESAAVTSVGVDSELADTDPKKGGVKVPVKVAPVESSPLDTLDTETTPSPDADEAALTVRALVSTKEAGVVIGKAGRNVAEVRDVAGVRAGVSKVLPGIHERILIVSGDLPAVAKAYALIARHLIVSPPPPPPPSALSHNNHQTPNHTTIRLLIPHQIMGSIIGKSGSTIRDIQESSGCKIVVAKEMLPNSTERLMELTGLVDSVQIAVHRIGEVLIKDADKAKGVIHFSPQSGSRSGQQRFHDQQPRYSDRPYEHQGYDQRRPAYPERRAGEFAPRGNAPATADYQQRPRAPYNAPQYAPRGAEFNNQQQQQQQPPFPQYSPRRTRAFDSDEPPAASTIPGIETQTLCIPSDLIGCLIGPKGTTIQHIREMSGSKISIAKKANKDGERWFCIEGKHEENEKALYMVYEYLEKEKARRAKDGNLPGEPEIEEKAE